MLLTFLCALMAPALLPAVPAACPSAHSVVNPSGSPAARPPGLIWVVAQESTETRRAAARAIVETGEPTPSLVLSAMALLGDEDPVIQGLGIEFMARPDLGGMVRPERIRALASLVTGPGEAGRTIALPAARTAAVVALGTLGDLEAADVLARVLIEDRDEGVRIQAAEALVETASGAPATVRLVRGLVEGALYGGRSHASSTPPDPSVMAVLLPRYGRWLAETPSLSTGDLMPLVAGLKAPNGRVRRASRRAFREALERLAGAESRGRAAALLERLGALGIARDVVLYQTARLALSVEGDARAALRAAQELATSSGLQIGGELRLDVYDSQLWVFRGHYLAGLAQLALGRVVPADRSLDLAGQALDAALAERRDLLAESERIVHVDLLHQRAIVEVARALSALVAESIGRPVAPNTVLMRARAAHERHLEAQAVYAEIQGDVMTGWDALLATDMSVYQLLFGRRGFAGGQPGGQAGRRGKGPASPLGRAQIVQLQGQLGRALASVAPGELPGFQALVPVGPVEVTAYLVDPLADPARRLYLERIRAARLSGIDDAIRGAKGLLTRARERAFSIIPEPEIDVLESLQRRRFAANQAAQEASRSTDRKWLRDLRVPGSAALWHAQDLKEEGRGVEARAIATRLEADMTERGISDWWFVIGHERVVRAQLMAGSAYTDEGNGEEAERVLTRAVERIEDIERDLTGRGAAYEDLAGFRALRSTALVSLAVNSNVRLLDKGKALGYYERAYELRQDEFMRVLMACYRARSGQEAESRSLLRSIRPGPGTWYNLACTHALLGDTSRALDYLEAEIAQNHASLESANRQREWAQGDPDLASLRGESRFERIVRKQ